MCMYVCMCVHVYVCVYVCVCQVNRGKAIIKRMLRRVKSNKLLWIIIFLIFAGIVFIIVWKTMGESDPDNNDTVDSGS